MIKRFLDYTEIRTKVTSLLTFALTVSFLIYLQFDINWQNTLTFFIAMLLFDLATTAINNYIDTKTNQQALPFKRSTALVIIYVLVGISALLGFYLVWLTDLVVLFVGALCFLCGICYTFGPIPISRMPLGEILSGLFYGLFIPFLILYINAPSGSLIHYNLDMDTLQLNFSVHILPILKLVLFSLIPFSITANIMLANNICDLKKDILVKRFTLPYYIGKYAIPLFVAIAFLPYGAVMLLVAFGLFPLVSLLFLLTIPLLLKNVKKFIKEQNKATTFVISIKNFILVSSSNTILLILGILFDFTT